MWTRKSLDYRSYSEREREYSEEMLRRNRGRENMRKIQLGGIENVFCDMTEEMVIKERKNINV